MICVRVHNFSKVLLSLNSAADRDVSEQNLGQEEARIPNAKISEG